MGGIFFCLFQCDPGISVYSLRRNIDYSWLVNTKHSTHRSLRVLIHLVPHLAQHHIEAQIVLPKNWGTQWYHTFGFYMKDKKSRWQIRIIGLYNQVVHI